LMAKYSAGGIGTYTRQAGGEEWTRVMGSIANLVWRDGSAVPLTVPSVVLGNVTAQGWQISDTGSDGWTNFTPPSTANMSYNGRYLRYYTTSGGQTYYSNTASIRVLSATAEREVTIDMRSRTVDGYYFNNGVALRINVNGTNLATNAGIAYGTGPFYYTFTVNPGDVVRFYWVNGNSNDGDCAVAVYYSDNPPDMAFNPAAGSAVSSEVLVYRLYRASGAYGNGTLMGEFTAQ
jgi:hypothetical protein